MIKLLGQLSLFSALLFSFLQFSAPLYGYYKNNIYLISLARVASYAQITCIIAAYCLLTYAFIIDDFSIGYVAANAHSSLPLLYRLTALWGGHEGSMLLWVTILSFWTLGFSFSASRFRLSPEMTSLTLAVLGAISFSFLCFIVLTSNPFAAATVISTGNDLNPLLQDPGFLLHPPMLYMGYVGFSVTFAITLGALLCNQLNTTWAKVARYFTLAAWSFLTMGILLGSWWAYRVLGWGGFWFWDPVENVSLLPWLTGVALIHVLKHAQKSNAANRWASLLAIISFALSLIGTFLVRSGILISAHTFASDPSRGLFLLFLLSALLIITFLLYAFKAPMIKTHEAIHNKNLLLNSGIFFIAMLTILLGTLYPLIIDALHLGAISVGAPYFNTVLFPFVLLILFLMCWTINIKNTGMRFAHVGFTLLIAGILLGAAFNQERDVRLHPGTASKVGSYELFFRDAYSTSGANYRGIRTRFDIIQHHRHITYLYPEKRIYTVRNMVTTKVAIYPGLFRDIYISLGEPLEHDDWSVRIYYKPFIHFIWLGGMMMLLGGLLSMRKKHESI